MAPRALALLALAAALAGCGNDRAARARFDQVRTACEGLVGRTLGEAAAAMGIPAVEAQACRADLGPVGTGDTCPGAPGAYTGPACQLGYEWCARGTSLCSGGPLGGCAYACEVRVAGSSMADLSSTSVICATRFVSGQPFGPISGYLCQ